MKPELERRKQDVLKTINGRMMQDSISRPNRQVPGKGV
jgi:hypothetical protein